uniref:Uncharacterized protein n=1 Tax=Arundo donax TaxID=35708 RepID=A0A0A9G5S6_ARUDO
MTHELDSPNVNVMVNVMGSQICTSRKLGCLYLELRCHLSLFYFRDKTKLTIIPELKPCPEPEQEEDL